jgi:hypothetical protein
MVVVVVRRFCDQARAATEIFLIRRLPGIIHARMHTHTPPISPPFRGEMSDQSRCSETSVRPPHGPPTADMEGARKL